MINICMIGNRVGQGEGILFMIITMIILIGMYLNIFCDVQGEGVDRNLTIHNIHNMNDILFKPN